jgi:integrase/recombinase XerD
LKLPNGYGSVYKLKGKRRRPWAVVMSSSTKYNGKRKREYVGYYETRAEALQVLASMQCRQVSKISYTLGQVHKEWMIRRNHEDLSYSARKSDKFAWERLKELEKHKMRDISTGQIQKIIDECKMSRATLSKIKTLAHQLYDYAMENDIVDKNYATFITLPTEKQKTKRGFTDLEMAKIEKAAVNSVPWADTVVMLCYTGFRLNEFLSLTPFNLVEENGKKYLVGGSKTKAGIDRIIPVHPKIKTYLDNWLAKKGTYIVCTKKGKKINCSAYRKNFYKLLEQLKIERLTPHRCRYTFATMCDSAKMTPKEVEQLMGHSTYAMSKKYTHIERENLAKAVDRIK